MGLGCEGPSFALGVYVDDREPSRIDLGDGAGERWRKFVRLGDRTFGPATVRPRETRQVHLGSSVVVPIQAFSGGRLR